MKFAWCRFTANPSLEECFAAEFKKGPILTMSNHDSTSQFKIAMPSELKAKIQAAATKNRRSMSAEIIRTLEAAFIGGVDNLPNESAKEALAKIKAIIAQADGAAE